MTEESKESKALSTSEPVKPQAPDAQNQFATAVDDLLDQLQNKFDNVSRDMFGKLDDMARRLDELEASLTIVEESNAKASASEGKTSPTK